MKHAKTILALLALLFLSMSNSSMAQWSVNAGVGLRSIFSTSGSDAPVVGDDMVKTMPKGFPKDFPFPEYIRPRLYTVWHPIPDTLVSEPDSQDRIEQMFRTMAPLNVFLNEIFDDYE